ncbi:MAG: hypothetical protein U1E76_20225 [Planctomycetota bacterium]
MTDERVKPCRRCEELFEFDLSYCPSCGALAIPTLAATVPHDLKPLGQRGRFDLWLVVGTAALAALGSVTAALVALLC